MFSFWWKLIETCKETIKHETCLHTGRAQQAKENAFEKAQTPNLAHKTSCYYCETNPAKTPWLKTTVVITTQKSGLLGSADLTLIHSCIYQATGLLTCLWVCWGSGLIWAWVIHCSGSTSKDQHRGSAVTSWRSQKCQRPSGNMQYLLRRGLELAPCPFCFILLARLTAIGRLRFQMWKIGSSSNKGTTKSHLPCLNEDRGGMEIKN